MGRHDHAIPGTRMAFPKWGPFKVELLHLSVVCSVEVICVLQRCPSPSVGRDSRRVVVVLVEGGGGGVLGGVAVDQGLAVGLEIEKK